MLQKTLVYSAVLLGGVLALAGPFASADDKKDDKVAPALAGTWLLQGGQLLIEFSGKDVMKIFPHGENQVIIVACQYTVDKNGLVKAKITELDGTEEGKAKVKEVIPVGLAFSFTWKVKKDTATLDDMKGDKVEVLKSHLEGKYEKKK